MRSIPARTVYCPLVVGFDDASGVRYELTMRPTIPEVNLTQVTCVH